MYQNSFCTFGYSKKEDKDARSFEITIQSRINPEALQNCVFKKYEMYKIHELYIKIILQLKPVMLQDFDFLLTPNFKTYEYKVLRDYDFF